ncbi:uncharacterized protein LOC134618367 [Pelmatolapia mariae]|uniref:uncharacterized protein LOC134618367 n=1 Tax=Pelmatolapia mariae TaxID=158779 RepID=UPI002FE64FED
MHTGVEGGNITVKCSFYIFGKWKLLCKNQCERGNILIGTTDLVAQNGRYFIKYEEEEFPTRHAVLYVSITQLEKSDSGLYRCYLDRNLDPYLFDSFQLTVTEASTPTLGLQSLSTSTTITKQPEITFVNSGFLWPVVIAVVMVVLVLFVVVQLICKKKTTDSCLNKQKIVNYKKSEIVLYENLLTLPPEESVYQSLDPASRDEDQVYLTLKQT